MAVKCNSCDQYINRNENSACKRCNGNFHSACFRQHISNCESILPIESQCVTGTNDYDKLVNLINKSTLHIIENFTLELNHVKNQNVLLLAAIEQLKEENATMRTTITDFLSLRENSKKINPLCTMAPVAPTEDISLDHCAPSEISNTEDNDNNGQRNIPVNTYARALTSNKSVVIITPNANQASSVTVQQLNNKIHSKNYNVTGVKHGTNGKIIIQCADDDTTKRLHNDAARELGEGYKISTPKNRLPRLKIVNITAEPTKEQLHDYLVNQNDSICDFSDLKVLHIAKGKGNYAGSFTAYIEVNGKSFERIMSVGFVGIGWERCRVFEDIKVLRCFNCCSFNHTRDKCPQRSPTCGRCAGAHTTRGCDSELEMCANCVYAADTLKVQGVDPRHPSWDRACPSYKRVLDIAKSRINYSNI